MKDRLYCEKSRGEIRRSAQTVLWRIGETLVRLMAPILSFTAEELWKHLPAVADRAGSVFLSSLPELDDKLINEEVGARWEKLREIREVANKCLELARAEKFVRNSLEAKLIFETTKELKEFLTSFGDELPDLFIVSEVEFAKAEGKYLNASEEISGLKVAVTKAGGEKCSRCWKFSKTVGDNPTHPEICARCASVVE